MKEVTSSIDIKAMGLRLLNSTLDKIPPIPWWVLPTILAIIGLIFLYFLVFLYLNFYRGGEIKK